MLENLKEIGFFILAIFVIWQFLRWLLRPRAPKKTQGNDNVLVIGTEQVEHPIFTMPDDPVIAVDTSAWRQDRFDQADQEDETHNHFNKGQMYKTMSISWHSAVEKSRHRQAADELLEKWANGQNDSGQNQEETK